MSTVILRPYQQNAIAEVRSAWGRGARHVLAVLPTGAGKTVIFSEIVRSEPSPVCAIAHRQELVTQISLALARAEVRHRIIGPSSVVRAAIAIHERELGRTWYHPDATVAVAGVDTLVRRADMLAPWLSSVRLVIIDEAHHVQMENKWGHAVTMFPVARSLGVTATPTRADGGGLGMGQGGIYEQMVEGPGMRDLILQGYLAPYRVFCPPSDLDISSVPVSAATGDFSSKKLQVAVQKSRIVGDVVDHYRRIANGKLGVTFATDVATANALADTFTASGVPAKCVSAKTPDVERAKIIREFSQRKIMQLVNVDLFGEGFDLPAIEVVSMARPTQSYSLFAQQFGRALRLLEGKSHGVILDHVGNVMRHGLPDFPRVWSLLAREKREKSDATGAIKITTCTECMAAYEAFHKTCPYCGHKREPFGRGAPEEVDGDLTELTPDAIEALQEAIRQMDEPADAFASRMRFAGVPTPGIVANLRRHNGNQAAQSDLRPAIVGWWNANGAGKMEHELYRQFYGEFGVDILTAQSLKNQDARNLMERICATRKLGS